MENKTRITTTNGKDNKLETIKLHKHLEQF